MYSQSEVLECREAHFLVGVCPSERGMSYARGTPVNQELSGGMSYQRGTPVKQQLTGGVRASWVHGTFTNGSSL